MPRVRCPSLGRSLPTQRGPKNCTDNNIQWCSRDCSTSYDCSTRWSGRGKVVAPESEAVFEASISAASRGKMETDSISRRSGRMTRQPSKLLDAADAGVTTTTPLRNVTCNRKAVTAEMRAIGLRPDGKQMLPKFTGSQTQGHSNYSSRSNKDTAQRLAKILVAVTQSLQHCALRFAFEFINTLQTSRGCRLASRVPSPQCVRMSFT